MITSIYNNVLQIQYFFLENLIYHFFFIKLLLNAQKYLSISDNSPVYSWKILCCGVSPISESVSSSLKQLKQGIKKQIVYSVGDFLKLFSLHFQLCIMIKFKYMFTYNLKYSQ